MGCLVARTVVVSVNRPLTIKVADWPVQMIEMSSNTYVKL